MRTLPDTVSLQTAQSNTALSGADCVISLAAPATGEGQHVIDWLAWSYDATPTSGSLVIQDTTNNTTLFQVAITASGPGIFNFAERGLRTPKNAAITITLGGTGGAKRLSVQTR